MLSDFVFVSHQRRAVLLSTWSSCSSSSPSFLALSWLRALVALFDRLPWRRCALLYMSRRREGEGQGRASALLLSLCFAQIAGGETRNAACPVSSRRLATTVYRYFFAILYLCARKQTRGWRGKPRRSPGCASAHVRAIPEKCQYWGPFWTTRPCLRWRGGRINRIDSHAGYLVTHYISISKMNLKNRSKTKYCSLLAKQSVSC